MKYSVMLDLKRRYNKIHHSTKFNDFSRDWQLIGILILEQKLFLGNENCSINKKAFECSKLKCPLSSHCKKTSLVQNVNCPLTKCFISFFIFSNFSNPFSDTWFRYYHTTTCPCMSACYSRQFTLILTKSGILILAMILWI